MASVYKLKRKEKHLPEQTDSNQQVEIITELISEDKKEPVPLAEEKEEQAVAEEIKSEEAAAELQDEPVKEEAAEEKQAEPSEEATDAPAEEKNIEDQESLFTPAGDEIPQSLLEALTVPKVDSDKLGEVFSPTRGTVGADSSEAEYDQTTDLLREIFGNEHSPQRKKKGLPVEAVEPVKEETEAETTETEAPAEEADEYIADHGSTEEKTMDYIAIHDGDEEKTKEFNTALNEEGAQEAQAEVPPLADEFHVSQEAVSDDPYSDTYEDGDTKYERKALLPDEFTSPEEYDEFAEHLRNKNYRSLSSILWMFLAFLAAFYLESACFSNIPHPVFLKPGSVYNPIFLLVDLELIFFSALLALPSLIRGVKALFKGKPDRNTVMSFLYLFTSLHTVLLLIVDAKEYMLFGCVAAFYACLNAIANFLDTRRIYRTFRICGSKNEKIVATKLEAESPEAETFRENFEGDPRCYSVQKASFIDNFFARLEERSKVEQSFTWVSILSLVFSIAFAVITYLKTPEIAATATAFMTMLVMTLPLSCVFSISLPFARIASKSEKIGGAIVSVAVSEEHAAADVVSFNDNEIFPPRSVKLTTIRTYGQTRIDKAILYSAMIFQKLGGPLSEVFKKTLSGVVEEISEDFEFKEITSDGMCASIEDQDIFVGNKNYLLSYDFGYTKDDQDTAFEEKHGKIMYMVIGNELAAKFYIRYSISKQFKKTVLSLFRSGICPAVKTCDPNIDSALLCALLQNKKVPAGIIKSCEAMKDAPAVERSDSGVVCITSIAKLLKTFSYCEALRRLTRANAAIKIFSLLVGIGVVAFFFFFGGISQITAFFVLIYQLLWLLPVVIPSIFE